ncbi:hypothetical protein [Arthrobacter mangrovi]|uniref:Uncharacterized protein n=1 Tax=Arthrobacter mangrovi TaxID=2966350 RepID=A0ABQ5MVQ7_9MICC|nr:hypothetical protein [Arthrobacter mangrovi]GLB68043.1 hypothetical protein AHIS1636_24850 [Arthrobacter mangrovi]
MNRQPEDELDALLSGGGDDPALARALASLRDLGNGPAPAPSAELSALFGSNVVPLRRRRRRGALLGVVVAASMGLGVGTVAAVSPDFRHTLQDAVDGAVVLVQPGVQAEEQNDGGNSAGAPVPEATRDAGGPAAPATTPAADVKDDPAADRADEAKKAAAARAADAAKAAAAKKAAAANKAAEDARRVPGEAAEDAGRSDDSASRTGVAPGNGQLVPGQAKKDELLEQAEDKVEDTDRAPERITVNPPGKTAQAPEQLKEKAKDAPGQLKKADDAPGQVKKKADDASGQLKTKATEEPTD